MEYQIKFFEKDLIQLKIEDFQKIEIIDNQIITNKIIFKNE